MFRGTIHILFAFLPIAKQSFPCRQTIVCLRPNIPTEPLLPLNAHHLVPQCIPLCPSTELSPTGISCFLHSSIKRLALAVPIQNSAFLTKTHSFQCSFRYFSHWNQCSFKKLFVSYAPKLLEIQHSTDICHIRLSDGITRGWMRQGILTYFLSDVGQFIFNLEQDENFCILQFVRSFP